MSIYIIVFSTSVLLLLLNEHIQEKNVKRLLVVIALLLPSIVAGVRDYTIGTDIQTYGNYWFEMARSSNNYLKFVQYANWSSIGPGYSTLNFLVSRFTENAHWFYFILNLIANILVYLGLKKNQDICNVSIGMAVYYFVFWGIFLNALRQSIALAIIFFSYSYLRRQKFIKFLVGVLIAMTFHNTAIISVVALPVHIAINGKGRQKIRLLVVALSTIFILFSWQIFRIAVNLGIISARYETYLNDGNSGGGGFIRIALYGGIMVLLWIFAKRQDKSFELNDYRMFTLYSLLLSSLSFIQSQSVRIAHYYDMYLIYTISYLYIHARIKEKDKRIFYCTIFILFLIYWLFVFVYRKSDQIVPYVFMES